MTGMSRTDGSRMTPAAHLEQSINDILTTPKGSRVIMREYGSDLPDLIDAPMNGETMVDIFAATAEALDRWEPRFLLERVQITEAAAGRVALELTGSTDYGAITVSAGVGL